ncbi:regulatory protein, LuxR:response regulator receiver [Sporolactobacillus inulinus]|uniref:Regulatory protein, LuxR:response regulator receiver n=1 Tax=Sporolactobacillus inulinus TaxID=2078 RepID=A0A4Y1ZA67_9BACL|nr:response regulator transcription factor [Sporolactobacillus inulinus]GAY75920.1 regulatory protein, LuxR:response regulator receiver [Sporolactobacillus inulinus]
MFLTTFSDDEYIIEALRIGAKGYILKQNFESIIPAIKAVFSGQRVFGDAIIDKIPSLMKSNEQPNFSDYHFSSRELAMIKLVANGKSNREIAQELYLSEGTVRNYISSILENWLCVIERSWLFSITNNPESSLDQRCTAASSSACVQNHRFPLPMRKGCLKVKRHPHEKQFCRFDWLLQKITASPCGRGFLVQTVRRAKQ